MLGPEHLRLVTLTKPEISVVIPIYNEEESLIHLFRELISALHNLEKTYEIIFIDDGSTDNSYEILKELYKRDRNIRVIRFRRNFGKASALSAGFKASTGTTIITMDADLQDEPSEIKKFLDKLDEGYDLVSGWKVNRLDPLSKTLPSKIFNFITSLGAGFKLHDFNCGFKAYRREVIESIVLYGDFHRYVPVLAHWKGFKVGEVGVVHNPRKYGTTKYGLERFSRGLFDFLTITFITRYSKRPLHYFGKFGLFFGIIGVAICFYLTFIWFLGESIGNRPLLNLGVLMIILGVQISSIGLLGEMLLHHRFTHKADDVYGIREVLGEKDQNDTFC